MKQAHWISITLFLQGNSMMARPVQERRRWTDEEDRVLDRVLSECKSRNWHLSWENIAKLTRLDRNGKSCWERYKNRRDPNVKRKKFSEEEDDFIIRFQSLHGNCWTRIAKELPGRTHNDVKNHWYNHLKGKKQLGKSTADQLGKSTADQLELPPLDSELMSTEEVLNLMSTEECLSDGIYICTHSPSASHY